MTKLDEARARTEAARSRALALAEPYRRAGALPGATELERELGALAAEIIDFAERMATLLPRAELDQKLEEMRALKDQLLRDAAIEAAQLIVAGQAADSATETAVRRGIERASAAESEVFVWIESHAEAAWHEACDRLAAIESGATLSSVRSTLKH